jgi:hypothetical protein
MNEMMNHALGITEGETNDTQQSANSSKVTVNLGGTLRTGISGPVTTSGPVRVTAVLSALRVYTLF